jgi:hypothetical protein
LRSHQSRGKRVAELANLLPVIVLVAELGRRRTRSREPSPHPPNPRAAGAAEEPRPPTASARHQAPSLSPRLSRRRVDPKMKRVGGVAVVVGGRHGRRRRRWLRQVRPSRWGSPEIERIEEMKRVGAGKRSDASNRAQYAPMDDPSWLPNCSCDWLGKHS